MERLFLAVELTSEARQRLGRQLASAAPGGLPGRPVPAGSWHLTLRFLGATDAERRAALERALSAAELGPAFMVRFGGLGAFPRAHRANVLWLGLSDGGAELARLAGITETAARTAGFPAEEKPFRAHLTLSRFRPPADVAPLVQRTPPADLEMPVRALSLMLSQLGSGPPRYERVAAWPLSPELSRPLMPAERLSDSQITDAITGRLPAWRFEDGMLTRVYQTGAWQRTLLLANAIGFAGEAAGHHPDLLLSYPRLTVQLTTHDAGGVTARDLALAERIEALATWQPEAESPLGGSPEPWFR
jgi:2'-5' RNA ligase